MKKIITLFLLVSTISFAQEDIEAQLGSFDEIKVFNGLHITLIKSDESKIEISGDKSSELVYKIINNRLKLSMRFPKTFHAEDVDVTVFFAEDIHLVDVNEGAVITSKDTFKQQSLELKAQEGAYINLTLDVKYLTIKSVTGGQIEVNGIATNQDIDANTGGIYRAYNLQSDAVNAVAATGGYIKVTAKELLDAKVRFGGSIYYTGSPIEVITEKVMGGTIASKD